MARRKNYKYGDFPVFQYQSFDSQSITFGDRPVVPLERIQFTDRSADELFKSKDEDHDLEIVELDPPADDDDAYDGYDGEDDRKHDGMVTRGLLFTFADPSTRYCRRWGGGSCRGRSTRRAC